MPKKPDAILPEVRMQGIVDKISADGNTTVADLSRIFRVSRATIRSDLSKLEGTGNLKRTHGGAVSSRMAGFELTTFEKTVYCAEEKAAIAKSAETLIHPGDTIALDTGTTMMELAKRIAGIPNLTVLTYDLQIASFLEVSSDAGILLIGGVVRRHYHCTSGRQAIDAISGLYVDKAFIAANGVTLERGASTPNMETAALKREIMRIAGKTYLLADSSKIGKNSFAQIAALNEFDLGITDSGASQSFISQAEQAGVTFLIAETKQGEV